MDDPFASLNEAIEAVFHLIPMRNGKYTYDEIQQLKDALDNYEANEKTSFRKLVKALGSALPHFEKWGINFEPIKKSVDSLAEQHKDIVDWNKYLLHRPKISSRLHFYALQNPQHDVELIPWLNTISERTSPQQEPELPAMLIAHRNFLGFSKRLNSHLKKDPEFLSRLIMESKENFIQIAGTRLILYLTDEQLAKAIVKYIPDLLQNHPDPLVQVEQLMDKLNGILSNGRSISALLRNSVAEKILTRSEFSEFFRIYQSEEYKNRQEHSSFAENDFNSISMTNIPK